MSSWNPPRRVRWLTEEEWGIAQGVFGDTLPFRQRVFLTDAVGANGRAFAIPTSAVSGAMLTAGGTLFGAPAAALIALVQVGASVVNAGYIIGVGPARYPDMTKSPELLVHEMTHVWQGKNRTLALSYALEAALHQCRQELTDYDAYAFSPGNPWESYNPEQQASIVETWFRKGCNESDTDPLYRYIRDDVRRRSAGKAMEQYRRAGGR